MVPGGRYQTLPLGSKCSFLAEQVSILQLYIFIWNMKSKVLDSQQWWSSIIIINLCSCNGLLASERPDRRVYASEFELLNKLWWWSYIVNVRHIWWTSVMYDRRHILWMSIINEYDGCPSCMTYGCQSYMYDGCPSYLMFYSHKFPSYMWRSFVMEAMEYITTDLTRLYCWTIELLETMELMELIEPKQLMQLTEFMELLESWLLLWIGGYD